MGRCSDAVPILERTHQWCLGKYGERNRVTSELQNWLERAQQGLKKDGLK